MGIKCAQYSKLAAITVDNTWGSSICIYYQTPDEDAAIKSANFKLGQQYWQVDTNRVTDPPLYGTSLTAVMARDGIQLNKQAPFDANSSLPVVYLQWHSLELAHAQGKGTSSSRSCTLCLTLHRGAKNGRHEAQVCSSH